MENASAGTQVYEASYSVNWERRDGSKWHSTIVGVFASHDGAKEALRRVRPDAWKDHYAKETHNGGFWERTGYDDDVNYRFNIVCREVLP